jgi:hypothetical protein
MYQGGGERFGIVPHVPLPDDAFLVPEQEFNGVFNGNDVSPIVLIEMIDHGGHGGGLATAGGAGYQDEPSWFEDDLLTKLGES